MNHTKICTADLDSPRRELSVRSLGFVVCSPYVFFFGNWFVCVCVLGKQSSCSSLYRANNFQAFVCTVRTRSRQDLETARAGASTTIDTPVGVDQELTPLGIDQGQKQPIDGSQTAGNLHRASNQTGDKVRKLVTERGHKISARCRAPESECLWLYCKSRERLDSFDSLFHYLP